jgi:hypothetical protein
MPLKTDITAADRFFTNADIVFRFAIYEADGITPKDVTGYALAWLLKARLADADLDALVSKETPAITITGTFNADPEVNTQRVLVSVSDEDTADVPAGFYFHELKRTDAGAETPLCSGRAVLQQSAFLS